jgi:hypothetical protein
MSKSRSFGAVETVMVIGICAVLFCIAWQFARTQVIWSDETTQLAGLKLDPVDQVRYLLYEPSLDPGVPYDRMPPLSYWLGWGWSQIFGNSEMSFRLMGVCATTLGCAAVALTGFMLGGRWGLIGAGLSFALSANVFTTATAIRAYPFLITFAALAMLGLVGFARSQGRCRTMWIGVALTASVLAAYSHFFGLILGGAVFSAAWVTALRQRNSVSTVVVYGVLLLLLTGGVWPFALVSGAASSVGETGSLVSRTVRLVYRLIGHPAASVDLPALGLLGLSFSALVGLALWRWPKSEHSTKQTPDAVYDAVPLAIVIGLAVTCAVGTMMTLFDVYRPSYSSWAIPAVHLLVAIALGRTANGGLTRTCARGATVILLAAQAWIVSVVLLNPTTFSHGPHRMLSDISCEHEGRLMIVHDGPMWTRAYFPLRFEFGPELEQWRNSPAQDDAESMIVQLPKSEQRIDIATTMPSKRLLVIGCESQGQAAMRSHLRKEPWQPKLGPLATWLSNSPDWREVGSKQYFSYVSAYALIFERVDHTKQNAVIGE